MSQIYTEKNIWAVPTNPRICLRSMSLTRPESNDTDVYMKFCCSIFIQAHFCSLQLICYITIIPGCCSS